MKKLLLLLLILPYGIAAQTDSIKTDHVYWRMKSENDVWASHEKSDRYFTNGARIEFQPPQRIFEGSKLKKLFISLPQKKYGKTKIGFIADMRMYTPEDITTTVPNLGDRPYAGTFTLGIYGVSNDFETATRITTEYQVGILGPAARQKETQLAVHNFILKHNLFHPILPQGWDTQVGNIPIINLRSEYEKNIFSPVKNMETIGGFEVNCGTVTNYIALNTQIRLGLFNDYFYNSSGLKMRDKVVQPPTRKTYFAQNVNRDFQIYFFAKPSLRFALYNTLLEGSPLGENGDRYVLSSDDLNRVYYNVEFGYALAFRRIALLYSQQIRSPEFVTAKFSKWGAVTMIVGL